MKKNRVIIIALFLLSACMVSAMENKESGESLIPPTPPPSPAISGLENESQHELKVDTLVPALQQLATDTEAKLINQWATILQAFDVESLQKLSARANTQNEQLLLLAIQRALENKKMQQPLPQQPLQTSTMPSEPIKRAFSSEQKATQPEVLDKCMVSHFSDEMLRKTLTLFPPEDPLYRAALEEQNKRAQQLPDNALENFDAHDKDTASPSELSESSTSHTTSSPAPIVHAGESDTSCASMISEQSVSPRTTDESDSESGSDSSYSDSDSEPGSEVVNGVLQRKRRLSSSLGSQSLAGCGHADRIAISKLQQENPTLARGMAQAKMRGQNPVRKPIKRVVKEQLRQTTGQEIPTCRLNATTSHLLMEQLQGYNQGRVTRGDLEALGNALCREKDEKTSCATIAVTEQQAQPLETLTEHNKAPAPAQLDPNTSANLSAQSEAALEDLRRRAEEIPDALFENAESDNSDNKEAQNPESIESAASRTVSSSDTACNEQEPLAESEQQRPVSPTTEQQHDSHSSENVAVETPTADVKHQSQCNETQTNKETGDATDINSAPAVLRYEHEERALVNPELRQQIKNDDASSHSEVSFCTIPILQRANTNISFWQRFIELIVPGYFADMLTSTNVKVHPNQKNGLKQESIQKLNQHKKDIRNLTYVKSLINGLIALPFANRILNSFVMHTQTNHPTLLTNVIATCGVGIVSYAANRMLASRKYSTIWKNLETQLERIEQT